MRGDRPQGAGNGLIGHRLPPLRPGSTRISLALPMAGAATPRCAGIDQALQQTGCGGYPHARETTRLRLCPSRAGLPRTPGDRTRPVSGRTRLAAGYPACRRSTRACALSRIVERYPACARIHLTLAPSATLARATPIAGSTRTEEIEAQGMVPRQRGASTHVWRCWMPHVSYPMAGIDLGPALIPAGTVVPAARESTATVQSGLEARGSPHARGSTRREPHRD